MSIWLHLQSPVLSTPDAPWLIAYFTVYFLCVDSFLHYTNLAFNDLYYYMNSKQRVEYRQYMNSLLHCSTSSMFAYLVMFHVCPLPQSVFNSHQCLQTTRNIHVYVIAHSCAYFFTDACETLFLRQSFKDYDIQMYVHHIASFLSLASCLILDGFAPVIGVSLLFIEVSTIFVNIRWLFY